MVSEYKQSIFQANKWDIIKIRKAEMLKKLRYLQRIALRKRTFIIFAQLNLYLKTLALKYSDVRNERIAAMRRAFASMICSKKFLRRMSRLGPSIQERSRRQVKLNVSFVAANYVNLSYQKAQDCLVAFIRRYSTVLRLQQPIFRFHHKINTMQKAFRKLLTRNVNR